MAAKVTFYQVDALPASPVAGGIYFVAVDAEHMDVYVVNESGAIVRHTLSAADMNTAITNLETTLGDRITALEGSSVTQADIDAAIAALVGGAPEALDTLKELADALADDDDAIAAINTSITNLGDRVTTNEGNITQLQTDLANLDTDIEWEANWS